MVLARKIKVYNTGKLISETFNGPSGNAFVSRAGGLRFKSRAGQIRYSVANDWQLLQRFFEKSCVAWAQRRGDERKLVISLGVTLRV